VTRRKIVLGSNNTAQLGIAGVRLPQSAEVYSKEQPWREEYLGRNNVDGLELAALMWEERRWKA